MVKKIVVIAISFALALGSFIYGNVAGEAVQFGAGTGVSKTIKSASELAEIISKVPTFDVYSENDDVSSVEGMEDFMGITVIESGYNSQYYNYSYGVKLPEQDAEDETRYNKRMQTLINHRLEMSFAKNAVYYHSIGTKWEGATLYYEIDEGNSESFYHDGLEYGERVKTDYDVEIYHSKDKTLIKINSMVTVEQRSTGFDYQMGKDKWVDYVEPVEDGEENPNEKYNKKMQKIVSDSYGKWILIEKEVFEPEEPAEPSEPQPELTPEQQLELEIDYLISEVKTQYMISQIESISAANSSNTAYLGRLSSFVADYSNATFTEGDQSFGYFKKAGNNYELIPTRYIEGENGYTSYVPGDAYLNNVVPGFGAYHGNDSYTNVYLEFNVNSDLVICNQKLDQSTKYYSKKLDTNTSFMYVNNTVVNLSKTAKVYSFDELYGNPLRSLFREYFNERQGGNE